MKRYLLILGALLFLTAPLLAQDGLIFSTNLNAAEGFAWQLNWNGVWTLSFPRDAIVVDASTPADPALKGDFVVLPNFTITGVSTETVAGMLIATGTITPNGPLMIVDKTSGATVMTATLPPDGLLTLGPNFIAYGLQGNDLTITQSSGSTTVIPALVAAQNRGLPIDLSFSGNDPDSDLSTLIMGRSGTANGGLSGQIHAIPAPGAILLGALGLGLVGWMRKRQAL